MIVEINRGVDMKVKNFCYNGCLDDLEKERKFIDEDGHRILLTLTRDINEYANQVNAIVNVIRVLEDWKNKEFYTNKTTYRINWYHCERYDKSIEKLTLKQAQKLYKETKIKYDVLYNLFVRAANIYYKDNPEELINKYFKIN